ncbi:flavin-containing monooxygenase [Microbacterium kyungheense]|uniref:Pyridine nucleotide-disulfide oxidoreductase n=1 Tax=Microbacterium kyungheense TaxID=1263636 RepID=A0A543F285_9MICO|nr:NAD(P)/FAD-dependent oxidoreductase [Microbacterium kyungheense]TQM27933.1 pyridine nucleotide-disulfide oxidoreductase [Microbacterium kyungheense]
MDDQHTEVLVVGAGPAGLAVAACLRRRGIDAMIVDAGERVGETWERRYERLHLHTPRIQSALPGLRMPRRFGRWVAKDDMAHYLRVYARVHDLQPRFGIRVRRVEPDGARWRVVTDGGAITADEVVLATGFSSQAIEPQWPGQESFPGAVLHASEYRDAAPYVGQRILVVGAGNSGAEIAADLAEQGAAEVRLAIRTPPNIIPRQLGPIPTTMLAVPMDFLPAWSTDPVNRLLQRVVLGDLTRYGMPSPRAGVVAQQRSTAVTPTIDVGLVAALRAGTVTPGAALDRFEGSEAVLADGTRCAPDAVIAATGYSTGLRPVVGHLGVLDAHGAPLLTRGRSHAAAPRLRFVGVRSPLKGLLLQINLDARAAARAIARDRRRHG